MRRFELVEGSSSKFWEIVRDGASVTVRYGRIGTQGQEKTKTHASDAAALKDADALIREKTGKGYRETTVNGDAASVAVPAATAATASTTASATAAATPASPAKTATRKPSAPSPKVSTEDAAVPASPAQASATAPATSTATAPTATGAGAGAGAGPATAASNTPAPINWPTGGMTLTPAVLATVPPMRGVHAPAGPDVDTLLKQPPKTGSHFYNDGKLLEAVKAIWPGFEAWAEADLGTKLHPDLLRAGGHDEWVQFLLQTLAANYRMEYDHNAGFHPQVGMHWLTECGLGLHGLEFMFGVMMAVAPPMLGNWRAASLLHFSVLHPLRRELARCEDDALHARLEALVEAMPASNPPLKSLRAMLFPQRTDWARAIEPRNDDCGVLLASALPIDELVQITPQLSGSYHTPNVRFGLALQTRLHGEAAAPLLVKMLERASSKEAKANMVAFLRKFRARELPALLAPLIERPEVRDVLEPLAESHPAAVIVGVAEEALSGRNKMVEGWLQRLALRDPAALASAELALDEEARSRLRALLTSQQAADCAPDQVPAMLREPPWTRKTTQAPLPTLALSAAPRATHIVMSETERAAARAATGSVWMPDTVKDPVGYILGGLLINAEGRARLEAGETLREGDQGKPEGYFYGKDMELLFQLPPQVALALWNSDVHRCWNVWNWSEAPVRMMLERHGEAAVPGLALFAISKPELGLVVARLVDSPALVPVVLNALSKLKKAKAAAIAWATTFPETFLAGATVMAFGTDKTARELGQHGLRWFVGTQGEDLPRRVAAELGAEAQAALQALLAADPLLVLPARMPKLAGFVVTPAMRRPLLRDGGLSLPSAAADAVATMLAISTLETPYAGLDALRTLCTPASLAHFAWDLFEAWLAVGAPAKEAWAFQALGHFGDDEVARKLSIRIREWPGESAHQRAVSGLDLLAAIGSDAALMYLNGIAGKVKFKGLQEKAREKIAALAEARGLTSAELADRLVPDLGLEDDGTLTLDFGPRSFRIGFDEGLKPFVRDADGARLKDLPKPNRSDDADLAAAATERYKQLKKDAKAIASLQVMRLELGMVERRRWSAADFRLFFLSHPLMRHLAARLAWAVYDGDQVQRLFRVAEDWTLADAEDTTTTLAETDTVGIAHPLEMPAGELAAMGQVFADYEILQPFRQLGRETFTLTDEERAGTEICRFADRVVATGSVLGLANRGWERGEAQDAGWVGQFVRHIGDGLQVDLDLDPGTIVGDPTYEPKQRIPRIVLRREGTWDNKGLEPLSRLHPIVASEVLRDASLLAPWKEPTT